MMCQQNTGLEQISLVIHTKVKVYFQPLTNKYLGAYSILIMIIRFVFKNNKLENFLIL